MRSIGAESNLAERIARERTRLGLSYKSLSSAMALAGCPIAHSALHRIEKGEPRRSITVDELVAFGQVFGLQPAELLVSVELVDQRRARDVIDRMQDGMRKITDLLSTELLTRIDLWKIVGEDSSLAEYVARHLDGSMSGLNASASGRLETVLGELVGRVYMWWVAEPLVTLVERIDELAEIVVRTEAEGFASHEALLQAWLESDGTDPSLSRPAHEVMGDLADPRTSQALNAILIEAGRRYGK